MENKYDIFISYCRDKVFLEESSGRAERLNPSFSAPLVLLLSPSDDSEMARNGFEDGSKIYAYSNIGGRNKQVSFVVSRTYVRN